jgi:hypothetical protein
MPRATFSVRNAPAERTIHVRMSGKFDISAMRAFCDEYKTATDSYASAPHYVLADMRGMVPAGPEVSLIFGSTIGYARARGVRCCAHLSDDTVQRLQAARLARQNATGDDVTIDVSSVEEGERVIREQRERERQPIEQR